MFIIFFYLLFFYLIYTKIVLLLLFYIFVVLEKKNVSISSVSDIYLKDLDQKKGLNYNSLRVEHSLPVVDIISEDSHAVKKLLVIPRKHTFLSVVKKKWYQFLVFLYIKKENDLLPFYFEKISIEKYPLIFNKLKELPIIRDNILYGRLSINELLSQLDEQKVCFFLSHLEKSLEEHMLYQAEPNWYKTIMNFFGVYQYKKKGYRLKNWLDERFFYARYLFQSPQGYDYQKGVDALSNAQESTLQCMKVSFLLQNKKTILTSFMDFIKKYYPSAYKIFHHNYDNQQLFINVIKQFESHEALYIFLQMSLTHTDEVLQLMRYNEDKLLNRIKLLDQYPKFCYFLLYHAQRNTSAFLKSDELVSKSGCLDVDMDLGIGNVYLFHYFLDDTFKKRFQDVFDKVMESKLKFSQNILENKVITYNLLSLLQEQNDAFRAEEKIKTTIKNMVNVSTTKSVSDIDPVQIWTKQLIVNLTEQSSVEIALQQRLEYIGFLLGVTKGKVSLLEDLYVNEIAYPDLTKKIRNDEALIKKIEEAFQCDHDFYQENSILYKNDFKAYQIKFSQEYPYPHFYIGLQYFIETLYYSMYTENNDTLPMLNFNQWAYCQGGHPKSYDVDLNKKIDEKDSKNNFCFEHKETLNQKEKSENDVYYHQVIDLHDDIHIDMLEKAKDGIYILQAKGKNNNNNINSHNMIFVKKNGSYYNVNQYHYDQQDSAQEYIENCLIPAYNDNIFSHLSYLDFQCQHIF